jgi:hypothetical protein
MTKPAGPVTRLTAVAGRDAARACPRIICIRPWQNTCETSGTCQGHGVRIGAPVTTGEHACVNVSDDAAHMGGQVYTWDIIRVVAMAGMKPNGVYAQWWR